MSVLAVVTDLAEASPVVISAHHSARALKTRLVVLCYEYSPIAEESQRTSSTDAEEHPIISRIRAVLDEIRTSAGGEPAVDDSDPVHLVLHPSPLTATLEQTHDEGVELIVASAESTVAMPAKPSFPAQLLRHAPCNLSLISTSGERSLLPKRVLAVATDSADDRSLIAVAHRLAKACDGQLTVSVIEADSGPLAKELGMRELRSVLKGAGIEAQDRISTQVLQNEYPINGIISIADDFDIAILGSKNIAQLPRLLASTSHATISIFRKAPPIRPWQARKQLLDLVPALAPADYADLVQHLRTGSRWNSDFRIMLGLAVGIASLGLLLNSVAVIIGSMLLAPLMTPMVGMGLAFVQGNARLARTCAGSVGLGILMALVISFVIGLALPGDELTPELTARGSPNLVDLLIALLSAAAGAYALARPTLAGSIAGVAIATALVPPLCTVGISLADQHIDNAAGAAMLFSTNFLAIVMAAAAMFRWMGLGASVDPVRQSLWVRFALALTLVATLILTFPLSDGLVRRLRKGVTQSAAAPLSEAMYNAVQKTVDRHPGVILVFGVRRPSSLDRPVDYRVVVASEKPLPSSFADEILSIVQKQMEDETLRVEVISIPQHWLDEESD